MKYLLKTSAAVLLALLVVGFVGFFITLASLDVGESLPYLSFEIERKSHAIFRIKLGERALSFNMLYLEKAVNSVRELYSVYYRLLPNFVRNM